MRALIIIALVAGCATHHAHAEPPVAPVVAVTPAQPVYVQGLDPQLAQMAAYSAAYRAQWNADHGAIPGAKSPVVYVSPGTVTTAGGGTVACPKELKDVDTLEERVACLESDMDYVISAVGVK